MRKKQMNKLLNCAIDEIISKNGKDDLLYELTDINDQNNKLEEIKINHLPKKKIKKTTDGKTQNIKLNRINCCILI
ncbi:Hypothetical protein KVN_LOCUS260 [uncultured virus]|nr:Hypothetical protein KVN_LOCUS260 [uncultured virus]